MPFDIRLKTSFNLICSGPTGSGKTTWVKNLLTFAEEMFVEKPVKVYLFYRVMQDIYLQMRANKLVDEFIDVSKQMPTLDDYDQWVSPYTESGGSMFIFDDSIADLNKDFENLFCNISHHKKCSIIFLTQNLYYKHPVFRLMSLNTHYLVTMKNDRDKQQISNLGRQISPGNSSFLVQIMQDATKKPYGYLFSDFKPTTAPAVRFLTNIFPHEFPTIAYLETSH